MCRCLCCNMLLMKQRFVVTHQYTVLQETERTWVILYRPNLTHIMFLWKYKNQQFFCGHNILTEGLFVTELSRCRNLSWTNCVGYDKMPFHERYVLYIRNMAFKGKLCRREPDRDRLTHHWCWGSDSTYCPEQRNFQFIVPMMHSQMYHAHWLVECEELMVHIMHWGWHFCVSIYVYFC